MKMAAIYDRNNRWIPTLWGEDDPRSNELAEWLIEAYTTRSRSHELYKDAEATASLLTITSNVAFTLLNKLVTHQFTKVYTLTKMVLWTCSNLNSSHQVLTHLIKLKVDGCKTWTHFLALTLVMQLMVSHYYNKYHLGALGKTRDEQVDNLVTILDGYFKNGGQHVNLNVMDLNDVYEKDHVRWRRYRIVFDTKTLNTPPCDKNWIDTTCIHAVLSPSIGWCFGCVELRLYKLYKEGLVKSQFLLSFVKILLVN